MTQPPIPFRVVQLGCVFALLGLTACSSGPQRLPSGQPIVIDGSTVDGDPSVIAQGLDPEQEIAGQLLDSESPWELAFRADQSPIEIAIALRLAAIDGFIALQDYNNAETQTNYLVDVYLDPLQTLRFNLQRAEIAQRLGQNDVSIAYIQPVRNDPLLTPEGRSRMLGILANAQLSLNRPIDALISLFQRDLLIEPDLQLLNQRKIISLLGNLNPAEQNLLRQSASNRALPANLVDGWLAFSLISTLPDNQQQSQLVIWNNSFPGHPASNKLLAGTYNIPLERFNHVALLLPLTSSFGNAAQAFYDGFIDAQGKDTNVYKPSVSLHDIGDNPSLATFYYQSAILEGADFVVGPLGRAAVNTLLEQSTPALPTLVIGDISQDSMSTDLYGVSLSPEHEARQVAEKAFADGHRQAGIFRSDSAWGGRAGAAFAEEWIHLGGTIVTNKSFPGSIEDYSRIIQRLLAVDQSVARERVLSAQLGINLHFTPRRRDDLDLLFFAGNAKQARLLVPQLRFFQAHNLPIYATSNIFNGTNNPAVDADLDKIIFGDMGWMINIQYRQSENLNTDPTITEESSTSDQSSEQSTTDNNSDQIVGRPLAKSNYSFTPLDRLYALGLESYHLIPRLSALRQDSWLQYNGQAFRASILPDGNVKRHLDWATFDKGRITPLNQGTNTTSSGQEQEQATQ